MWLAGATEAVGDFLLAVNGGVGCMARTSRVVLQCWGRDINPIRSGSLYMVDVGSGFTVQAITMGWTHTCVLLKPGGVVKCWGGNWYGQLGLGHGTDTASSGSQGSNQTMPAAALASPGSLVVATALEAGQYHTCAILGPEGRVKCWGCVHEVSHLAHYISIFIFHIYSMNNLGQLGLGDNVNRGTDPAQMGAALPFVDLGPGLAAVALAAGDAHTCAVLQPGGRVKCWGSNTAGQLGLGDNRTRGLQPTDMGAALPFVDLGPGLYATAIAAGLDYTCALLQPGGRVKCWGANGGGQLGLGDNRTRGLQPTDMGAALPFVDLGPGLNATAIAAGLHHTCALLQPGSFLKCWGVDYDDQLGRGVRRVVNGPAVQRTDSIGDEPGEMGASLQPVVLSPDVTRVKAVAVSPALTCAVVDTLTQAEQVKCWGRYVSDIPPDAIRGNPDKQLVYKPGLGAIGDVSEDIKRSPLLECIRWVRQLTTTIGRFGTMFCLIAMLPENFEQKGSLLMLVQQDM
ncbi:hypothetical protein VOLCADRAFT_91297 [Volvox carteri f. nagariensis]|uniref:Uncharacterized protein n=1 Tax=Volvox carteri f. nagariensis TaxID=3068 RepID=D8TWP2_VOLCA|nr:uncharacterized protein VOLCADRAFT_91297 [Volvox carteri f. nagariensis]EFJ48183.1 hypothetical protein VOLCADRAFT_91297 [Volvox carteri f. nagariensis]|eukprot:XP_002950868.1 hypothetical protein VOLCADRAFT_91297 [Volvox carteri f. nagariensis]